MFLILHFFILYIFPLFLFLFSVPFLVPSVSDKGLSYFSVLSVAFSVTVLQGLVFLSSKWTLKPQRKISTCDVEMSKVGCRCERLKRDWYNGGCFDQSEGFVNGHTETYNCIKEIGLNTGKGVPISPYPFLEN